MKWQWRDNEVAMGSRQWGDNEVATKGEWTHVNEVAARHTALLPDVPFFGAEVTVRLPRDHPLVKGYKHVALNANVVARVTGLDGRTTAGVRIQIDVVTPDGSKKICYTTVAYDSLRFRNKLSRLPDDKQFTKHLHPDLEETEVGEDGR